MEMVLAQYNFKPLETFAITIHDFQLRALMSIIVFVLQLSNITLEVTQRFAQTYSGFFPRPLPLLMTIHNLTQMLM